MGVLDAHLAPRLEQLRQLDRYRTRRVVAGGHGVHLRVDGRDCVHFCSNDYLGLATDPRVRAAARAALEDGCGSTASPLVCGYNECHARLEAALADFTGYPRALLFTSGWATNLGVLRGLLGRGDTLLADELNHASLIDGGRLSGARYRRVAHGDLAAWREALVEPGTGLRLMVTDSVFSMDGDLAPLPGLSALAVEQGAALMVDDAHGLGVLGPDGRGAVAQGQALVPEMAPPDIYVATLGKSLGSAGGFVAGSETLIESLVQRARSWIYSTASPPALAAAALAALRIVQDEPQRREHLHRLIHRFREGVAALGLPMMDSQTAIQPLVMGDDARALAVSRALLAEGYWVAAIRPPTVPEGTARLRFTLSAAHTEAEVDGLLAALARCLRVSRGFAGHCTGPGAA